MRKILILLTTLTLASCAPQLAAFKSDVAVVETKIKQAVSPDNLDTIEAYYGATLASAVAYRGLCQQQVINKTCWKTIASIQPYEAKAYNAYIVLRNFVRANPNADTTSLVQIAKAAIDGWKSFQTQQGVK